MTDAAPQSSEPDHSAFSTRHSALRVVLVAPFGLRPKGTTIARALPIGKVLAGQGAAVRLVIPPWDDLPRGGQTWTEDGVEIVHTRVRPSPLRPAVVLWDLLRAIREFAPDVVHVFKPIGYSGAVAFAGARGWGFGGGSRGPLVVVDADDLEGNAGWAGRKGLGLLGHVRGMQETRTLRMAARMTVASRWLQDYVVRLGVPQKHILYLPNGHDNPGSVLPVPGSAHGIDTENGTGNPQLMWYTRFTEADPNRVARLLASLLQSHPELKLTVVGDGLASDDRARAAAALARAGIARAVEWLDYDASTIPPLLNEATIAIYPMDDDVVNRARCPSKVPQLMALGIPIVAEAVGEVPVYLRGLEDRCLVAPGDQDAFRQRVEALIGDVELRRDVAARLRAGAERWCWERTAGDLLAWYNEARGTEGPLDGRLIEIS